MAHREAITIVSGWPRSGTSLMMQLLAAAGIPLLADDERPQDLDNPAGYFEYAPVRQLQEKIPPGWIKQAKGKAVKVVYPLLRSLPLELNYHVILMQRNLAEVAASQNAMLRRRGQVGADLDDGQLMELLARESRRIEAWIASQANFCIHRTDYNRLIADPVREIAALIEFLSSHCLSPSADQSLMLNAVQPSLYRHRIPS